MTGLQASDFNVVVEKVADRDIKGALGAVVTAFTGAALGPVAGIVAGKSTEALLRATADTATGRFLQAGKELDDERARERGLRMAITESVTPKLNEIATQAEERFTQMVVLMGRTASADQMNELLQQLRALGPEPKKLPTIFEGPGRVPARRVQHFAAVAELRELELALNREDVSSVILHGMLGVGKTCLAQQLVTEAGPRLFPDGVAWLDAAAIETDLPRVARSFGYSKEYELNADDASDWLSVHCRSLRALLVIDGWDSANGLARLPIPGERCKVLITTRNASLEGQLAGLACSLEVRCWDSARCREYLRRMVPAFRSEDDHALDLLAEEVGGLPLALAVSARQASREHGVRIAEVLQRRRSAPLEVLGGTDGISDVVGSALRAAASTLDRNSQLTLSALCVCARRTKATVIAAIAQLPERDVTRALNELTHVSLAEYLEGARAPWTTHEIVKIYAQGQPDRPEREAAHSHWVAERLAASVDCSAEDFEWLLSEALTVFERGLAAAPVGLACEALNRMYGPLTARGRYALVVELASRLLLQLNAPDEVRALWLGRLGYCKRILGDVKDASKCLSEALQLNTVLGNLKGQARDLTDLGRCFRTSDEISQAICHFERARDIYGRLGETEGDATPRGLLGFCWAKQGNPQKAVDEFLAPALEAHRAHGNLEGEASCLGDLGVCYSELQLYDQARLFHEEALALERALRRLAGEASQLSGIGICLERSGRSIEAIPYFTAALAINEQVGRAEGQTVQLAHLATCYETLGEYDQAVKCYTQAIAIDRLLGRHVATAEKLGALAGIRVKEAKQAFDEALELYRVLGLSDTGRARLYEQRLQRLF
jgi:tetratricopeptide (TPR) repeat protein